MRGGKMGARWGIWLAALQAHCPLPTKHHDGSLQANEHNAGPRTCRVERITKGM